MRDRKAEWKRYYEKNRDRLLAKGKAYRQTEGGKEAQRRANEVRRTNPEVRQKRRIYNTEYARKHYLPIKGVRTRVEKRPRPDDVCEICGKKVFQSRNLHYHHWDDEHPEWGLWVCTTCHKSVEFYEQGKLSEYIGLKIMVETGQGGGNNGS